MNVSRRRFLTTAVTTSVLAPAAVRWAFGADTPHGLVKPLPRQKMWQDCEVGAIFHFDMPLFAPGGRTHRNSIRETWNPGTYNPTKLDTDQWIAAAKAMGARYAIFTATHFNGFLQWQSDLYPYGVKQASWRSGKGDVVHDFVNSCRNAGILPGLYMSCFRNAYWKVDRYRVNYGKGGPGQAAFARTCEKMFEQLCSRYGDLIQIWFDAGNISPEDGGPDLVPIADRYQPNMVFYHCPERREHRWIGNEHGSAAYPCWATMPNLESAEKLHKGKTPNWRQLLQHGDPDGRLWSPGMADMTLRNHYWFWRPNTEKKIESVDRLVRCYYESVGRNCNLVVGLTPDPTGLLPEPDVRRCVEFGAAIRTRFGRPIAETDGRGSQITLELPAPAKIDHVVLMEAIESGERIRKYIVEASVEGDRWVSICDGSSVGHKRIQQFKPVEVAKIRLRITESIAKPQIRKLAVYSAP